MALEAVLEHLRGLKARGVKTLSLDPKSYKALKAKIEAIGALPKGEKPAAKKIEAPSAPVAPTMGKRIKPVIETVAAPAPVLRVSEPAKKFNESTEETTMPRVAAKKQLINLPAVEIPAGDKKTQWEWLRNKVLTDPKVVAAVPEGKQAVFGIGNIDSPIFFCGEAPGAEEEEQGEPFVGRAGQLLTKIIEAMGESRKTVYIGNIMNYRPPMEGESGNRPPTYEEMAACLPYLKAQVKIVAPKVIVALGATATHGLLGYDPERKMGEARGNFFEFEGIPVMVTYHPSYLLRNNTNAAKRVVWEDLLKVMRKVGMPINEKQEKFFT